MIHPTAVIEPGARIGSKTSVGPGAIIGANVEIGEECEVRAHAVITGHTRIGSHNQIGYGAIVGAEPQDLSYKGAVSYVEIGDHNTIREYATIHRGAKEGAITKIGNHNFLMTGVHIAHNCQIGNNVILANNSLLGGYVVVQDRAFLGGGCAIHQHVRIGELAMVGGAGELAKDVPPFSMVVGRNAIYGLNRVGLRRNGYSHQERQLIQKAYTLFYRLGLNRQQALHALQNDSTFQTSSIQKIVDFMSTTKRGVCYMAKAKNRGGEVTLDEKEE